LPAFDEYFPFNKGFGSPANASRWQKMSKIWSGDGVDIGVDFQFGNVGNPTTYAGTTVTLQSGAVYLQGYYAELLASAPLAITVPNNPTGVIVAHLNILTSVMEPLYLNGLSVPPVNSATDAYLFLWKLVAGVFTDKRVLVGPIPIGNLGAPLVPASGVSLINDPTHAFGFDCTVYVTGGTVTNIAIDGMSTGLTSGTFKVRAGQGITIIYSVAPTWVWFGG
jgi:hypothetical protein